MKSTTVYGSWTPSKDELPCNPMEAWPSMPRQEDAQFYGSAGGSGIFLYASPDDDKPYAILEYGPRGGGRQKTLPDSVDDFLAHMASRDPQDLEADRAAAWARSPE